LNTIYSIPNSHTDLHCPQVITSRHSPNSEPEDIFEKDPDSTLYTSRTRLFVKSERRSRSSEYDQKRQVKPRTDMHNIKATLSHHRIKLWNKKKSATAPSSPQLRDGHLYVLVVGIFQHLQDRLTKNS